MIAKKVSATHVNKIYTVDTVRNRKYMLYKNILKYIIFTIVSLAILVSYYNYRFLILLLHKMFMQYTIYAEFTWNYIKLMVIKYIAYVCYIQGGSYICTSLGINTIYFDIISIVLLVTIHICIIYDDKIIKTALITKNKIFDSKCSVLYKHCINYRKITSNGYILNYIHEHQCPDNLIIINVPNAMVASNINTMLTTYYEHIEEFVT
jgi:hypothetical protein